MRRYYSLFYQKKLEDVRFVFVKNLEKFSNRARDHRYGYNLPLFSLLTKESNNVVMLLNGSSSSFKLRGLTTEALQKMDVFGNRIAVSAFNHTS